MSGWSGRRAALALLLVAAAARAGTGPSPVEATLPELLAEHRLVLVSRLAGPEDPDALERLLEDLATVYGPYGLGVAVVGRPADARAGGSAATVRRLREESDAPRRSALVLHRPDGSVLAAVDGPDDEPYAILRHCERELRGRPRASLHDHVDDVLRQAAARGDLAQSLDDGRPTSLEDLLREHPGGCLLLPPGCSSCLLEKHAHALADALDELGAVPALVFEAEAADGLERFGWQGAAFLLPTSPEARLLVLRQAVHYAPVLVDWPAGDRWRVRPLRAAVAP